MPASEIRAQPLSKRAFHRRGKEGNFRVGFHGDNECLAKLLNFKQPASGAGKSLFYRQLLRSGSLIRGAIKIRARSKCDAHSAAEGNEPSKRPDGRLACLLPESCMFPIRNFILSKQFPRALREPSIILSSRSESLPSRERAPLLHQISRIGSGNGPCAIPSARIFSAAACWNRLISGREWFARLPPRALRMWIIANQSAAKRFLSSLPLSPSFQRAAPGRAAIDPPGVIDSPLLFKQRPDSSDLFYRYREWLSIDVGARSSAVCRG